MIVGDAINTGGRKDERQVLERRGRTSTTRVQDNMMVSLQWVRWVGVCVLWVQQAMAMLRGFGRSCTTGELGGTRRRSTGSPIFLSRDQSVTKRRVVAHTCFQVHRGIASMCVSQVTTTVHAC